MSVAHSFLLMQPKIIERYATLKRNPFALDQVLSKGSLLRHDRRGKERYSGRYACLVWAYC